MEKTKISGSELVVTETGSPLGSFTVFSPLLCMLKVTCGET